MMRPREALIATMASARGLFPPPPSRSLDSPPRAPPPAPRLPEHPQPLDRHGGIRVELELPRPRRARSGEVARRSERLPEDLQRRREQRVAREDLAAGG